MRAIYFLVFLMLFACDSGSDKTPEQIQEEVAAFQKRVSLERQRIEKENKTREEKLAEQRSFVSATFVSVNPDQLEVLLSNDTDKAIDNQVGSLELIDAEGNFITGIALTNWVPGDIYLPVGGSARAVKSLKLETPERRRTIVSGAHGFQYRYTILRIQFAGEDEINFQDNADTAVPMVMTPVKPPEPVSLNQVSAEPCAANQLSIETNEQYYPGPECSHLQRNIDSERFKQEYILLCQSETGASSPPAFVERVQLSSCIKEPSGQGHKYRKQICCDIP